jgi:hypothetical protein
MERVSDILSAKQLYVAVAAGKPEKTQLFFDAAVLQRYRDTEGYKIIRTDTSGRVSKPNHWSIDFGISGEDDSLIHFAVEGILHRIPEAEHAHWLSHMVTLPVSRNYLKGALRPGCIDDGMIRNWL